MQLRRALRVAQQALIHGDETARIILFDGIRLTFAELLMRIIYPHFKMPDFGNMYLLDKEFIKYYESFEGKWHYRTLDRKYTLNQLMSLTDYLEGDTAECGVLAGATSYLMCKHLAQVTNGPKKRHHVFDSFEGLSQATGQDGKFWGTGELSVEESVVRQNLQSFDFVRYYKGWIPERFGEVDDQRFSVVHIDVDLYQPTFDSIVFFYERMVPGGLIICDDYGFITCPGATRAFDECMIGKSEKIVRLTTGQGLIIKVP